MNWLWHSAIGLLVATGGLLGAALPLGKLAVGAGVSPVIWSLLISAGAGSVLLAAHLSRGGTLGLDPGRLRYFFIVAAVSYGIPNLLMFSAMPHLGAGYVGIMFTLTPMLTLVISILLRVRRPNALGVAGIVIGFAGALLVAVTRGEAGQPASLGWVAVGLSFPFLLSFGNVYRTLDWPKGADPLELAAGSHLACALMLVALALVTGSVASVPALAQVPLLSLLQIACASGMFTFFFRLQVVGGPVYLSQISYVAAAVGLVSGTFLLGESYHQLTWIGALIIVAGVVMTTKAQNAGG
jgi:drug/metabolite transporter (DMT)-like permease